MKLCSDCKHSKAGILCGSPSNGISVVTGEPIELFAYLQRESLGALHCGPDALHFSPKPPPKKPWWGFFAWG
jgi:hypothetical protein